MKPGFEQVVHQSWQTLASESEALVRNFYARLFELAPGAGALFAQTNEDVLRRKLLATLEEIVRVVDEPERVVTVLVPLGRRHGGYGVTEPHYLAATAAFVLALRETLGERCTDDVVEAWRELFTMIGAVMFRAGIRGGMTTAGDRGDA